MWNIFTLALEYYIYDGKKYQNAALMFVKVCYIITDKSV